MKSFILVLSLLLLLPSWASADDIIVIIAQKQKEKRKRGWSLADWMDTKKKIALMDQWLALNSSANIFEVILDGQIGRYSHAFQENNTSASKDEEVLGGGLSIFASIFGINAHFEATDEIYTQYSFSGSLRLFGRAQQSTNITLHYGMRQRDFDGEDIFQNQFWGASMDFNLFHNFGFEGQYRQYLESSSEEKDIKGKGYDYHYGAFFDLLFIRLYGNFFREEFITYNGERMREQRKGVRAGLKLFF